MVYKVVQTGITGLTPKLKTFFPNWFEFFIAFSYHGSQAFPVIFKKLQQNVVFILSFLYISDFLIQQFFFKFSNNILVLDATENVCKLENSTGKIRRSVGEKGDSLTTEQNKCTFLSEDKLKKFYGKWSKNQLLSTLSHVGKTIER